MRTDKYKAISAATPVMAMLHSKAIRPCLERFSSTLISVGSFLAFGSSPILVWLMKSTAFTRFMSFSFISGAYFANFTRSAVSNITFRSWIDSFVLLLQQTLDNFRRRHFHGIESETLLYIYTDDIGQFRIIAFGSSRLATLSCLDSFNLLHGSQVRRKFRFYLDILMIGLLSR